MPHLTAGEGNWFRAPKSHPRDVFFWRVFFGGPEFLEGISGELNWDLLRATVSCIINDKSNNEIHENDINNHNNTNDKNQVIRMMIIITVPVIVITVGNIVVIRWSMIIPKYCSEILKISFLPLGCDISTLFPSRYPSLNLVKMLQFKMKPTLTRSPSRVCLLQGETPPLPFSPFGRGLATPSLGGWVTKHGYLPFTNPSNDPVAPSLTHGFSHAFAMPALDLYKSNQKRS